MSAQPTRVAVGSMRLDPPSTKTPGRARYRITLQCGCSWWEHSPVDAVPHRVGDAAYCFNPAHTHGQRIAASLAERSVAAAVSVLRS